MRYGAPRPARGSTPGWGHAMTSTLGLLFSRKPALVPEGVAVPRLERTARGVSVDPAHLARYRALCAIRDAAALPLAYPHLLASRLHLELLGQAAFPVRLLGLVHLGNRIECSAPLPPDARGDLHCWLEGFEDTERGHVFRVHSEWRVGAGVPWREVSTLLARRPRQGGAKEKPAAPRVVPPDARRVAFDAPAGLGRRYAAVATDWNPIHLSDVTARAFGFPRAIAHGMWSLARCAAELDTGAPCAVEVAFKRPVLLPARLALEVLGDDFTLADATGEVVHLVGSVKR